MSGKVITLGLCSLFLWGCSPKSTVILLDSKKSHNAIIVANEKSTVKLDKVGQYVGLEDNSSAPTEVKVMSKDDINKRFSKVLAAAPAAPLTYILYFKPSSTELTDASKEELKKALSSIEKRSPCVVDIIGHTDTVGSSELNAKVSLKRAKHIQKLVKKQNLKIISLVAKGYGEADLQLKTDDNIAEAKNRNVEIFIK